MSTRSRAFTLIEVLVALAIVAFGMSAVFASMTSAANNALYMRDKTLAEWVALNQLAVVRLKPQMPAKGKTDGEVDDFAGRKWVWVQEVKPLTYQGMWRIDVSVRPLEEGESKSDAVGKKTSWYVTESAVMGDAVARGYNDPQYLDVSNGVGGAQSPDDGGTEDGHDSKTPPKDSEE